MIRLYRRLTLALRLASLAATTPAQLLLFIWSVYASMRVACAFLPVWIIRVPIRFPNAVCSIEFRMRSDIWELKDVLLDKEYAPLDLHDPKIIIELGSNIGISTVYLATQYPNARILTTEPNPFLASQLAANISACKNIDLHTFALAAHDGPIPLYVGTSSLGSSLERKAGQEAVSVEGVSADRLLERLGIEHADLIKFDIEGAEQYLFRSFAGLESIDAYLGEVHYDRMPITKEEVRETFRAYRISSYSAGRADREILYMKKKT
jgi:FkbM family methyltransferase